MGGKRKDYDGQWAMIEVGFVLDDPRLDALGAAARWIYLTLWCLAIKERREILPPQYTDIAIARRARVDVKTTKISLGKLMGEHGKIPEFSSTSPSSLPPPPKSTPPCGKNSLENSLIGKTDDGRVIVYGVRSKHPNLKWKNGDISENIDMHIRSQKEREVEIETNAPKRARKNDPKNGRAVQIDGLWKWQPDPDQD